MADVIPIKPLYVSDCCTHDVDYPSEEGFVAVRKGESGTSPVTIKSLVDESVKIRLILTGAGDVSECRF